MTDDRPLELQVQEFGERVRALGTGLSGTVVGQLWAPVADFALSLKDGKLGTDALSASARVRLSDGALAIRNLAARYVGHTLSGGSGSLVLAKGTFALSALYRGEWWAPRRTKALRRTAAAALRLIGNAEALQALEDAAARGPRGVRVAARAARTARKPA